MNKDTTFQLKSLNIIEEDFDDKLLLNNQSTKETFKTIGAIEDSIASAQGSIDRTNMFERIIQGTRSADVDRIIQGTTRSSEAYNSPVKVCNASVFDSVDIQNEDFHTPER